MTKRLSELARELLHAVALLISEGGTTEARIGRMNRALAAIESIAATLRTKIITAETNMRACQPRSE